MKVANAPDKRPAIAYDRISEIMITVNALRYYKTTQPESAIHHIDSLIDEYEKVLEMFKEPANG
tara:strand:- start:1657 stop:1848 length:192 start_codon:yes stop_codon:yes gene_type:complete